MQLVYRVLVQKSESILGFETVYFVICTGCRIKKVVDNIVLHSATTGPKSINLFFPSRKRLTWQKT